MSASIPSAQGASTLFERLQSGKSPFQSACASTTIMPSRRAGRYALPAKTIISATSNAHAPRFYPMQSEVPQIAAYSIPSVS